MTRPPSFSERPGFTIIGGRPTTVGPVMARLNGSRGSFLAVRAGVGHAMTRICGMIVLDETGELGFPFEGVVDERERSVAEGILGNNHVSRVPVNDPGLLEAIRHGIEAEASLFIIGPDDMAELADSPELMTTLLEAPFDVLLLATEDVGRSG